MIHTEKLTLAFDGRPLFDDVNVKFVPGNCYGLIGANGAGKSTFLKLLSGKLDPTHGNVIVEKNKRIAVLSQDQFAFDDFEALETVIMGHQELYKIYSERNALYAKPEMTNKEGERAGELECLFADMDGYNAESNAATMLSELGIAEADHNKKLKDLESGQKIRILLAQSIFGNPDILLLDEPTNQLDYNTVLWLENFLLDFKNTVIVVSHDRHFLNKVCTHIADLDYKQIKTYVGNYDFWYQASQLTVKQRSEQHKKQADKIKELETFVQRFSSNASKSKQATSRKKLIEKLRPEDLPTSTRRTPFINFKANRPCGNKIVEVTNVSHSIDGEKVLDNVSFYLNKKDKVAIIGKNSLSKTVLLQILAGEIMPDSGSVEWGDTITKDYFPKDNTAFFKSNLPLEEWIRQYTDNNDNQFLRGLLGRMLFSGDDINKKVSVLSGGEKARAMFSKIMLTDSNVLLFDEPTDHLDLEAITALNDGLKSFQETLLFTSHDFQLLNTVINRVIEVSPKGMVDQQISFNDYIESPMLAKRRNAIY